MLGLGFVATELSRAKWPLQANHAIMGLVWMTAAAANAEPISWAEHGAVGGVLPLQDTGVRVLTEDVEIILLPDGSHFQIRTSYSVFNEGQEQQVLLGVPYFWESDNWKNGDNERPTRSNRTGRRQILPRRVHRAAASVILQVHGVERTCRLDPLRPWSVDFGQTFRWFRHTSEKVAGAWCVEKIDIPGNSVSKLVLTYGGELIHTDFDTTFSEIDQHSKRGLVYQFHPSSQWKQKGKLDRLSVTIRSGLFTPYVSVVEPQAVDLNRSTDQLSLILPDASPSKTPRLVVEIDNGPLLDQRQAISFNSRAGNYPIRRNYRVISSSFLRQQGQHSYSAEMAIDGRADTAWCEGVGGSGIGEWIELELDMVDNETWGFAVIPGYAKDRSSFIAKNRITKIGIGRCGQDNPSWVFLYKIPSEMPEKSMVLLNIHGGQPVGIQAQSRPNNTVNPYETFGHWSSYDNENDTSIEPRPRQCLRFHIFGVRKGHRDDDSCISEVVPMNGSTY